MLRPALLALALLAAAAPAVAPADPTETVTVSAWASNGHTGWKAQAAAANVTALVVVGHGYGHNATSWIPHLREIASHGAVALAVDYGNWEVAHGAAALTEAARDLRAEWPHVHDVVLLDVSMGNAMGGVALAAQPQDAAGGPLFDWWFDVEGVANLVETYAEARLAASFAPIAAKTVLEIEAECGGASPAPLDCLAARSPALRAEEIAEGGLRGAWEFHAVNDGLVPYNQAWEMVASLAAAGVPTTFWTVTRGPCDDPGTTLTGYAGVPTVYCVAGHATETSDRHEVIRFALDTLGEFIEARPPAPVLSIGVHDNAPLVP